MPSSSDEHRRAFTVWLRTGWLPSALAEDQVEGKYNHWHDPEDGRFTFAGAGRHDGSARHASVRGGGGTFGGAGATGGWSSASARPSRVVVRRRATVSAGTTVLKRPALPQTPVSRRLVPVGPRVDLKPGTPPVATPTYRTIVRNGYAFQIDERRRTRQVSGTITLSKVPARSRAEQRQAGGRDRRQDDEGGHYIAARFNGPTEAFNHFAQNANFNRGRYRAMEDEWAKATKSGKPVQVTITPSYLEESQRPSTIQVSATINGIRDVRVLSNKPQERPSGKR